MKTIIAGSRDFNNYSILEDQMSRLPYQVTCVVGGGAKGADRLGELWAEDTSLPFELYKADWDAHGKKAGILRNTEMANNAEALVAFWDGKSLGTKNMIETAIKKGLEVTVCYYGVLEDLECNRLV